MKRNAARVILPVLLSFGFAIASATAAETPFAGVYELYRKGDYPQAIEALKNFKAQAPGQEGLIEYWTALCRSRLQSFEQAALGFERAEKLGVKAQDLDYERGQALYSSQQLRPAREAFKKSALGKYKVGPSLYYEGYISQMLEELPAAFKAYQEIVRLPSDPEQVKQAAFFQLAELSLAQAEKIQTESTRNEKLKKLLPEYQKVVTYDVKGPSAVLARRRLGELQRRLGTDIPRMRNGVPIAAKPWYLKVSQDAKYDTNVITEADQSVTQVSNKASAVSKTTVYGKYEFIYGDAWSVSPEGSLNYAYHLNREAAEVYQNDSLTLTAALRSRNEHTWLGGPAALMADVEFISLKQDYTQTHTLLFYNNTLSLTVGERARLLSTSGSTTLLGNFKIHTHEDDNQSAVIPGLTLSQNFQLAPEDALSLIFGVDYYRTKSSDYEKYTYRLTGQYGNSSLIAGLSLAAGLDLMLTNPVNQRDSRGIEKMIGPSVSARRDIGENLFVSVSYAYTKNISIDTENYAYSKQLFGLTIGGQF